MSCSSNSRLHMCSIQRLHKQLGIVERFSFTSFHQVNTPFKLSELSKFCCNYALYKGNYIYTTLAQTVSVSIKI